MCHIFEQLEKQGNLLNGIDNKTVRRQGSKGGFFSESVIRFSNLQKKIFQKTILGLKFKFPTNNSKALLAGNLNFKFRIVFWNISFLRFGDLKNESHFLKKSHL